jgi:ATPase subunit of ABC transporter with duplicated ATPase domains
MAIDLPGLYAGERRLLGPVRLALARDARVQLAGRNGAGKTTLLRALVAGARCPRERILEVPQDMSPETCQALLHEVRRADAGERGRVLTRLDALGVDPGALLATPRPSPGEARKLLLARGLARGAWALVLDEPTNHLDLPAIERLEAALLDYPGAILLVSHDAALASRVTGVTWTIADGEVHVR